METAVIPKSGFSLHWPLAIYLVFSQMQIRRTRTGLGLGIDVLVTQALLTAESVAVCLSPCWGLDLKGDGGFPGGVDLQLSGGQGQRLASVEVNTLPFLL